MGQHGADGQNPRPVLPLVVTIAGLKRSGKTTVASALIAGLRSRGLRVGSVKTVHGHALSLDLEATDTRRHAEAGAEFTIALLDGETAYFEPRASRASLGETARLFRPGVQLVVWEGVSDAGLASPHVVCLRSTGELERTLAERHIDPASVIAISGIAAGRALDPAPAAPSVPILDVTDPIGLAALVDLVARRLGEDHE